MESHVMPNQLGQSGRLTFDLNWFLDARNALDSNQKLYIANELHSCISQLRNLKGDYIGAVGHGKAIIGRRISLECGPFDSEQQFNDFILGDIVRSAPNILRHYAKHALMDNHEIFFHSFGYLPAEYFGWRRACHGNPRLGRCWLVSGILGIHSGASTTKTSAWLARLSPTYSFSSIREIIHRHVLSSSHLEPLADTLWIVDTMKAYNSGGTNHQQQKHPILFISK